MDERTLQEIIFKYPSLIENMLLAKGMEVQVQGKRVDVLFEDRHGQKLILEVKKGTIRREDVAQLLDYEGYFVSKENPNVRVMLVGTRVPENLRRSLDHHGFEWRELSITSLVNFLNQEGDNDLLSRIQQGDYEPNHAIAAQTSPMEGFNTSHAGPSVQRVISTSRPGVVIKRDSLDRAISHIRSDYLTDPSFLSVRLRAEGEARRMLESSIGKMSKEDIKHFLGYMNTESIKGRTGLTRFGRHFTNIVSVHIFGCPDQFNEWIGLLWKAEEHRLPGLFSIILKNAPIKGAGTLLPTFILYLRMPLVYNIWTQNLGGNLETAISGSIQQPSMKQTDRYLHFNHNVSEVLVKPFHLLPQEVDLVLSQLPQYL